MQAEQLRAAAGGDSQALAEVTRFLREGESGEIARAAAGLSPRQATQLILRLRPGAARALLRALPDAPSLRVLASLDSAIGEALLDQETQDRIARIVAKLSVAEAADFLVEAPAHVVEAALDQLGRPDELVEAVAYRADQVGAVMRHQLVAVPCDWTIERIVAEIRANAELIDRLYAVYVIDRHHRLLGYLKVRDLLLLPAETPVSEAMRTDTVVVAADSDRADVAALAAAQRLPVLPVIDAEGRLVGQVTSDEIRAIERAEAVEDAKLMAGVDPAATPMDGPLRIVPRRLPWLAAGLVGAGTAAVVVGAYEEALTEAAILASLIPIVMSLAGNAGIQAATVTVQAQTAGAFWIGDLGGRILREIGGALLNGGLVGLLVAAVVMLIGPVVEIERAPALGLTAALTLTVVTLQAATVGSLVPVALERLGFDPAVATGVFITTSNDVVGVLIFFLIATQIYL